MCCTSHTGKPRGDNCPLARALTTRSRFKSATAKTEGHNRRAQHNILFRSLAIAARALLLSQAVRAECARADAMSARKRAAADEDDEVVLSDDDDGDVEPAAQRARVAKEYPPGTVLKARACAASLVHLHVAALAHARAQRAQRRGSAATRTRRGLVRGPRARTRHTRLTWARCGSAVAQVRMVNFMTYTDVTVEPGPRLNLILGPNGTGALARNGPFWLSPTPRPSALASRGA